MIVVNGLFDETKTKIILFFILSVFKEKKEVKKSKIVFFFLNVKKIINCIFNKCWFLIIDCN